MNLSKFYYSSAEFKIFLSIPGGSTSPIFLEEVEINEKIETEAQHVVGDVNPVAITENSRTYNGKFSGAVGQMELLLKLNGLSRYTDIANALIIISSTNGIVVKRIIGVFVNSAGISMKKGDKNILSSLDFEALDLQ
jgi:hypothetical protein